MTDGLTTLVRFGAVDSTQRVAWEMAAAGAADGLVVVADVQTAGRGRQGRRWQAAPGTALLVSILARPRLMPRELPLLSFAAGLAVAEGLARVAGLRTRLKWPNDVMVGPRKLAGILLESRQGLPEPRSGLPGSERAGASPAVVIGIGVNLTQRCFPPDLASQATSVLLETGREVARDDALAALLEALAGWRTRLEHEGFAPLRERWLALADVRGRQVMASGASGVAVDLDLDGALVLRDGRVVSRVVAGEISIAAGG
jgi:BirA family biotin operon repressor/biotin-[acetyl-CoA-carboxylase] ligase